MSVAVPSRCAEVRRARGGKGVVIPDNLAEAEAALRDMLVDDKFGKGKVVIEEFLTGPEFSFLCFVWP